MDNVQQNNDTHNITALSDQFRFDLIIFSLCKFFLALKSHLNSDYATEVLVSGSEQSAHENVCLAFICDHNI